MKETELLNYIQNLKENKNEDCISLLDAANILTDYNEEYLKCLNQLDKLLDRYVQSINYNATLTSWGFDYKLNILKLHFYYDYTDKNTFELITLKKENGKIVNTDSSSKYSKEVLNILNPYITYFFDKFLKFRDLKNPQNYNQFGFRDINNVFKTYLSLTHTSIECSYNYNEKLELQIDILGLYKIGSNDSKYTIKTNSKIFQEKLKNHEEEL